MDSKIKRYFFKIQINKRNKVDNLYDDNSDRELEQVTFGVVQKWQGRAQSSVCSRRLARINMV